MKNIYRITLIVFAFVFMAACIPAVCSAEGYAADHYFYDQLDDNEKAVYNSFAVLHKQGSNLTQFEYCVWLPDPLSVYSSQDFVYTASYAFEYDHPFDGMCWNFYIYDASGRYPLSECYKDPSLRSTLDSHEILFRIEPIFTEAELRAVEMTLDSIVEQADRNWSRYQRASYLLDVVSGRLQYDWNEEFDEDIESSVMCIRYGKATCEGFSRVYKTLADKLDLPCTLCNGDGHMFVLVQMEDGQWYMVEPQGTFLLGGWRGFENGSKYYPFIVPVHWNARDGHGAVHFPSIAENRYIP